MEDLKPQLKKKEKNLYCYIRSIDTIAKEIETQEFLHYKKDRDSREENFYYDSICAYALMFCTERGIVEIERGFLPLFYCLALLQ